MSRAVAAQLSEGGVIVFVLSTLVCEPIPGLADRMREWVDFKGAGPAGPYDLRLGSKKFELATRRPTDLHETVMKQTPFEKNLVNAETYTADKPRGGKNDRGADVIAETPDGRRVVAQCTCTRPPTTPAPSTDTGPT
ncbi:hypothetical protein [Streptomyces arenae]|uniref:hypothetical protein n=1 Tax=Streptomyces arenae TaxID=29301 RepID=UPI003D2B7DF4